MAKILFLIMIGFPIMEVLVFIQVGTTLGAWVMLAGIAISAVGGIIILRRQGLSMILRVQKSIQEHTVHIEEIFDGFYVILAAIFLIIPGFITDFLGLTVFIPQLRFFLKKSLCYLFLRDGQFRVENINLNTDTGNPNSTIIDVEYEDLTISKKKL